MACGIVNCRYFPVIYERELTVSSGLISYNDQNAIDRYFMYFGNNGHLFVYTLPRRRKHASKSISR